jgi:thioredoxin 1
MKLIKTVNEANFKSEVLNSMQPVLVDFRGGECGTSKTISSVLEEVAIENKNRIKIVNVQVDQNPGLARQYYVRSVPTLIYFRHGLVYDQITGMADKKEIVEKLEAVLIRELNRSS